MSGSIKFNWNELRSRKERPKLAQVVIGIIVIGLEHPRPMYYSGDVSLADYILLFIALNATLVTLIRLVDSVRENHPIRRAFGEDFWCKSELWFTGLAAFFLYCSALVVLFAAIATYRKPELSIVGSVFALVASGLYLKNWWRLFRDRNASKNEIDVEQPTMEETDNVKPKYLATNLASVPLVGQFGQSEKSEKDQRNVEPNIYI